MKRLQWPVLAAACLLAAGALAQIDPDPDGIGIYADLGGLVNSIQAEPGEAIEIYLLTTRTTHNTSGVEFRIIPPANAVLWGLACPHPNSMLMTYPDGSMQAVWPTPVELPGDAIHVLTFIIRMLDGEPGLFYIGSSQVNSGLFNSPVYCTGQPDYEMYPLHPYPGGEEPVFSVNAGRTPVEPATWGAVKGLFQP